VKTPELIVMLTYNDQTVNNAEAIFDSCKNSQAMYWGFKEKSLPLYEMKQLFSKMKKYGKTTFLEVVAYTEKEGLAGAKIAKECGCDILMGTKFFDSINDYCIKNHLKYMPFVGQVVERPSILKGQIEDIIEEANTLIEKGVYGFDLLGYRFEGDATELNRRFVNQVNLPVCIAGSIDSYSRLDDIKLANPWAFTIGSAFFDNQFNGSFQDQINSVCQYIRK